MFKSVTQKVKEDQIRQEMEIVTKSLQEAKPAEPVVEEKAAPAAAIDVMNIKISSAANLLAMVQASLAKAQPTQSHTPTVVSSVSHTQPRSFGDLPQAPVADTNVVPMVDENSYQGSEMMDDNMDLAQDQHNDFQDQYMEPMHGQQNMYDQGNMRNMPMNNFDNMQNNMGNNMRNMPMNNMGPMGQNMRNAPMNNYNDMQNDNMANMDYDSSNNMGNMQQDMGANMQNMPMNNASYNQAPMQSLMGNNPWDPAPMAPNQWGQPGPRSNVWDTQQNRPDNFNNFNQGNRGGGNFNRGGMQNDNNYNQGSRGGGNFNRGGSHNDNFNKFGNKNERGGGRGRGRGGGRGRGRGRFFRQASESCPQKTAANLENLHVATKYH